MQKESWFHKSIYPAFVLKKGAESDFVPLIYSINSNYEKPTDTSGKKSWWTQHVEQNLPDIIARMLADPLQPNKDTLFAMQKRFKLLGKPSAQDAANIAETAQIRIPATLSRSPNDARPEYVNIDDLTSRTGTLDKNTGKLVFHGSPWGNDWLNADGTQKPFDPSKFQQGAWAGTGFYVATDLGQPANAYSVGHTAAGPEGSDPAFPGSEPRSVVKTYRIPSSMKLATFGKKYSDEELQAMADVLSNRTNQQYDVSTMRSYLHASDPRTNIFWLLKDVIPDPIDPATNKPLRSSSTEAKAAQQQRENLQNNMWMAAGYDGIEIPDPDDESKAYISIHHTGIDKLEHVLDEDRAGPVPDKNAREQFLGIIPDTLERQPRANLIRQFPKTVNLIENSNKPVATPPATPDLDNKGILQEWRPDIDRQQPPAVPSPEAKPAPVASVTPQKTWFQSLFGSKFTAPEPTPTPGGFTPREPTSTPGGFTPPDPTPTPGGFTPPDPTPKLGGFRPPPAVPTPVPTPVKPVTPEPYFSVGLGSLRVPRP